MEDDEFLNALTNIASLSMDEESLLFRQQICEDDELLEQMKQGLEGRNVLLKCKIANAFGALCMSIQTAEKLFLSHPQRDFFFSSFCKMLLCKNIWAQSDACFVLGWLVPILPFKNQILQPKIIRQVLLLGTHSFQRFPTAHNNKNNNSVTAEQNLRSYSLVFLLHLLQNYIEDMAVYDCQLLTLLQASVSFLLMECDDVSSFEAVAVDVREIASLVVAVFHVLIGINEIEDRVIEMKLIPQLLKLRRITQSQDYSVILQEDVEFVLKQYRAK